MQLTLPYGERSVRVDQVEHADGDAGVLADLGHGLLPLLGCGQLVQLGLQLVCFLRFLTQPVGQFGFLVIGFGEFLPLAGLRLPVGRILCRVAMRLPAPSGVNVCCCVASCACVASCCVLPLVSVLSGIRAPSFFLAARAGVHPAAVRHRVSWPVMGSHHDTRWR